MPTVFRTYALSVIAAAALLLALSFAYDPTFPDLARYAVLTALAVAGATLKVKLPGIDGNISLNFVFVLIGVAALNLPEALISAGLATLVQCFWKRRTRAQTIQVAFNIAVLVLSTGAAYGAPAWFQLQRWHPVGIVLSACAFFLLDSVLVAGVIALAENRSMAETWQQAYLWTFPYYLAGAAIAAGVTFGSPRVGWRSLLVLILAYLSYQYYRTCVERQNGSMVVIRP